MFSQFLAEAAGDPNGFTNLLGNPIVMIVIFMILFWVLLIRPQRKAMKEQQARINALKAGDKVITNAGIHGSVAKINDTTISLRVADGVQIEMDKAVVVKIVNND